MQKSDLSFSYPPHLVATEKKAVSRVMYVTGLEPVEVTPSYILTQIEPDDILVVNDTKVIPARVHSHEGLEILFIQSLEDNLWQVLCPAKKWPKGKALILPGDVELELVEKGRPQIVRASKELTSTYFFEHGEMPLPPYIQEARGERKARVTDEQMYQTDWAENIGSLAAPTASLHFTKKDLDKVRGRGAQVLSLSLHVGLGTFLPIYTDDIDDHQMHGEWVSVPLSTWQAVEECKKRGGKVWALGSTVTRALESTALGFLEKRETEIAGETKLFIKPGFEFKVVDVLMTNFHQPESTLVAMVMAFTGIEKLRSSYQWAIDRNFRLFSYGDLTVWKK